MTAETITVVGLLPAGSSQDSGADRLNYNLTPIEYFTVHTNSIHPPDDNVFPTLPGSNLELNYYYAIFELLVAVVACVGNALVITVFHRERRLRKRTNYYIVSLAMADFLVGLLGIPFAVLASIGLPTDLYGCLLTLSTLVVLCTISIFCLVAVSIDRYWAILYPLAYSRNVRTKTAICIISFCWFLGIVIGFLPIMGWRSPNAAHTDGCFFVEVMDYNYLVFLYFATIITPALLLLAFYAHIYTVIMKQVRKTVTVNSKHSTSDKKINLMSISRNQGGTMLRVLGAARKREVKATQNLSIIVLFFMICWLPLYTINCIKAFCPDCHIPDKLTLFLIILSHLNSAVNPLLYAYHLKDFRAALKSLICTIFGIKIQQPEINYRFSIHSQNRLASIFEKRTSLHPKIYIDSPVYLRQQASSQSTSPIDLHTQNHNSQIHRNIHAESHRQTTSGDLHMWRILEVSAEDRPSTAAGLPSTHTYPVSGGHQNYVFDYDHLDGSQEKLEPPTDVNDSPQTAIRTVSAKVQWLDEVQPAVVGSHDLSIYDRCREPSSDVVHRRRSRSLTPPTAPNRSCSNHDTSHTTIPADQPHHRNSIS